MYSMTVFFVISISITQSMYTVLYGVSIQNKFNNWVSLGGVLLHKVFDVYIDELNNVQTFIHVQLSVF